MDHTNLDGYIHDTTPFIESYAKKGVVFSNAFSQAPWTRPSMASIHSSLYSFKHLVTGVTAGNFIRDSVTTLAEVMKGEGFHTGAFVTIGNVKSIFGFSQGFDYFNEEKVFNRRALVVNQEVKKWVRENRDNKFFLWIHYIDPHDPYMPPLEYNIYRNLSVRGGIRPHSGKDMFDLKLCISNMSCSLDLSSEDITRMEASYDGEIKYLDYAINDLFSFLSDENVFNKSLIVFTADHGEEFMEHNNLFHGNSLYNEQVHVPLIVWAPGLNPGRISKNVALVDIYPTVTSFIGKETRSDIDGVDLFTGKHQHIISENYLRNYVKKGIIKDEWKLIHSINPDNTTGIELFNVRRDPNELNNIVSENPDIASELESTLLSTIQELDRPNESTRKMDNMTLAHLKGLGYII